VLNHLSYFLVIQTKLFEMTEKNQVNSVIMSVKGRLVNIVTAGFNSVTGQMTEMSQRKKTD